MVDDRSDSDSDSMRGSTRGRQWFAFFGGAVAWLVHLLGIYLISEFGCVSDLGARQWWGISVVAWALIGASVALLAIAVAATIVGYWDARGDPHQSHEQWLSHAGWIFSLLFAAIIAVEAIPALFYLREC